MDHLPPPAVLTNLISGKMVTHAIGSFADLGIADLLKDATRSVDELAREAKVSVDVLYRLLRALSLVDVVTEHADRTFSLTPVGACLRRDIPGNLHGMARFFGAGFHTEKWASFNDVVRTGQNAMKLRHGLEDPFKYFETRPQESALFNDAMTSLSQVVAWAMGEAYDTLATTKTIVDVGGGHGVVLQMLLERHPHLNGVLFDLPKVVEGASKALAPVKDRCKIVAGSFFDTVPAGGDLYLFKHIIHDWDDDACVRMLTHAAKAMAPGAKVAVVEHVIPGPQEPSFGKLLDLEMLVFTNGGRERTEAEFAALFAKSGLKLARIVGLPAPIAVVEAVKA